MRRLVFFKKISRLEISCDQLFIDYSFESFYCFSDFWDNSLGLAKADKPQAAPSGNNLVVYSLPTIVDSLAIGVSYASDGENDAGSTAWGTTYTGIDGLSVSLGQSADNSTTTVNNDQTIMKASYAYGSFTFAYSDNEMDHTTETKDQEVKSMSLAYTISDNMSVTYGEETISKTGKSSDIEIDGLTGSYTTGGMTIALTQIEATNVDHSNATAFNDNEFWKVSLSFAF